MSPDCVNWQSLPRKPLKMALTEAVVVPALASLANASKIYCIVSPEEAKPI